MRSRCLIFVFAIMASDASFQAGASHAEPPAQVGGEPVELEDIVVTGHRYDLSKPKLEPIAYYRDYCFESNRLKGRSTAPVNNPDWLPLEAELREKLKISDPETTAFILMDGVRKHTLILKIERLLGKGLQESRCTLIVVGGTTYSSLKNDMSALFHSSPYQGSLDNDFGMKSVPGWQHWIWTGMPARRSKSWEFRRSRGSSSRGIIVIDPRKFYGEYNYVLADLKINESSRRAISTMGLVFITRGDRRSELLQPVSD